MHGALNVGKKKLIAQFVCKCRDELLSLVSPWLNKFYQITTKSGTETLHPLYTHLNTTLIIAQHRSGRYRFFFLGRHAAQVGPSGRTDALKQVFPHCLGRSVFSGAPFRKKNSNVQDHISNTYYYMNRVSKEERCTYWVKYLNFSCFSVIIHREPV
jgi:hypothetical protein